MTLRGPNRDRGVHKRANLKLAVRLISALKAHKLLKRGYEGYLYNVVHSVAIEPSIEIIPIVCEYPNVFPKEIPGMPLPREVDFCIDLAPRSAPISKVPYRTAQQSLEN